MRIADPQAWEPVADSAGLRSRSLPGWPMHWAGSVEPALRDGARIREAPREFLVPARDQRRPLGDAARRRQRFFLDLVVGHDAVHQALVFRLLGAEHAALEQDLERDGAPDEIDERLHLAVADHQPELRDRDAETARGSADAQVALRDDL